MQDFLARTTVNYGNVLHNVGYNIGTSDSATVGNPNSDLLSVVGQIIQTALGLLGVILLILSIYAGFLWMTAGGNEETVTKARTLLRNGIIGLFITLAAHSIAYFVTTNVGSATSTTTETSAP